MPQLYYERWRARVRYHGTEIFLGSFPTEREAKTAQDEFWRKHGGKGTSVEKAEALIGREQVELLRRNGLTFRKVG